MGKSEPAALTPPEMTNAAAAQAAKEKQYLDGIRARMRGMDPADTRTPELVKNYLVSVAEGTAGARLKALSRLRTRLNAIDVNNKKHQKILLAEIHIDALMRARAEYGPEAPPGEAGAAKAVENELSSLALLRHRVQSDEARDFHIPEAVDHFKHAVATGNLNQQAAAERSLNVALRNIGGLTGDRALLIGEWRDEARILPAVQAPAPTVESTEEMVAARRLHEARMEALEKKRSVIPKESAAALRIAFQRAVCGIDDFKTDRAEAALDDALKALGLEYHARLAERQALRRNAMNDEAERAHKKILVPLPVEHGIDSSAIAAFDQEIDWLQDAMEAGKDSKRWTDTVAKPGLDSSKIVLAPRSDLPTSAMEKITPPVATAPRMSADVRKEPWPMKVLSDALLIRAIPIFRKYYQKADEAQQQAMRQEMLDVLRHQGIEGHAATDTLAQVLKPISAQIGHSK